MTTLTIYRRCKTCGVDIETRNFHHEYQYCDNCTVKKDFVPRYQRLCDMQVEPDGWPSCKSRYTDDCPVSSQLEKRQKFREFVIGSGCFHTPGYFDEEILDRDCPRMCHVPCGDPLHELLDWEECPAGPSGGLTFHTKVLLLTEMLTEVTFYPAKLRGSDKETIRGITFCKDDSFFDTGCVNHEQQLVLKLDPKFPYIKSITLQQRVWQVAPSTHTLEKRITYLRIEPFEGDAMQYGELLPGGMHNEEWVLEPEVAEGTLVIVGVGYVHAQPLSFQLVDCSADPEDPLESVFICRGALSCVSVNQNLELYEHYKMPAVEDPEVYELLENLLDGIENASPSDTELLPNAIKFIDKAHQTLDTRTMFSIFRIDRYLMHVIHSDTKVGMWDSQQNHWRKLLPLKHMLAVLSEVVMMSRRLEMYKPQMNVYSLAILTKNIWDKCKAFLTFGCQLMLVAMLMAGGVNLSIIGHEIKFLFASLIITAIVSFIVSGQVENHFAVRHTLTLEQKNILMSLDFLANVVISACVVLIDFALLASVDEYFDLVMNCTAMLFILEIDDSMMTADEEQIKDLFRSAAYNSLQTNIRKRDVRYWIHSALVEEKPKINMENCALIWLEPFENEAIHASTKTHQR